MEVYIDHYSVLGLPSGEKGTKVSYKDITKAYKIKALELHPDKKPNDPNAVTNFQNLQASYQILIHENTRNKFDDDLIRRVKLRYQYDERKTTTMYGVEEQNCRRTRAAFNKQERSRAAFEKRERKRAAAAFEERERKRAAAAFEERETQRAAASKAFYDAIRLKAKNEVYDRFRLKRREADKENVLKVFWAIDGLDYSEKRLREVFEKFGEVEDVIMSYVNRGSALIVMANKDGVVAAGTVCGDLSNPLLVRPVQQEV